MTIKEPFMRGSLWGRALFSICLLAVFLGCKKTPDPRDVKIAALEAKLADLDQRFQAVNKMQLRRNEVIQSQCDSNSAQIRKLWEELARPAHAQKIGQ